MVTPAAVLTNFLYCLTTFRIFDLILMLRCFLKFNVNKNSSAEFFLIFEDQNSVLFEILHSFLYGKLQSYFLKMLYL